MKKKWKILITLIVVFLFALAATCSYVYVEMCGSDFKLSEQETFIYIDRDDTMDSVQWKVMNQGMATHETGYKLVRRYRKFDSPLTGRYRIEKGESMMDVVTRFSQKMQTPMNLTVGNSRTMDRLSRSLSNQLMIDSVEIIALLTDTALMRGWGYDRQTLPVMIVPDTYQVYWDITAEALIDRIRKEHERFWNGERLAKAEQIGLSKNEVCTLASIVDEETNNAGEKPMVAGLYMKRLQIGMPLQADPTVKFALQNFTARRITNSMLKADSPYNTYIHRGLPPGPIRIASKVGIDAVLNYVKHDYVYMCAKEDFSGTHNFSRTYSEHLTNARRYQQALNKRKIFK